MPVAPSQVRARPGEGIVAGGFLFVLLAVVGLVVSWSLGTIPHAEGDHLWQHVALWTGTKGNSARSIYAKALVDGGYAAHYLLGALLPLVIAAAAGMWLGLHVAQPRDDLIHLRGRQLSTLTARAAKEAGAGGVRDGVEIAPGVRITRSQETRGLLVAGAPGSGKTVFLKGLVSQALARGDRVILHDVKGDLTAQFPPLPQGKLARLMAPWDARGAPWALARDLRTKLDIRRFAACIVPASQDPMWASAARQILVGLVLSLRATRGDCWAFSDLARACTLSQPELAAIMTRHFPEGLRAVQEASKTTDGILINLAASLSAIHDLAEAWQDRREFSLSDWLHGHAHHNVQLLVMQNSARFAEIARPLISSAIESFAAEVAGASYSEANAKPLWIILDELPQLQELAGLAPLIEVGRSKQIRVVVATQTIEQLRDLYGRDRADSFAAMLGTSIIFRVGGETAEWASRLIGEREVERVTSAPTSTPGAPPALGYSRETVPVLLPAEFAQLRTLASGVEGVLLVQGWQRVHKLTWPFPKGWKDRRPGSIEADWLSTLAGAAGTGAEAQPARHEPAHGQAAEPAQRSQQLVAPTALTVAAQRAPEKEESPAAPAVASAAIDLLLPGAGHALEIATEVIEAAQTAAPGTPPANPGSAARRRVRRFTRRPVAQEEDRNA